MADQAHCCYSVAIRGFMSSKVKTKWPTSTCVRETSTMGILGEAWSATVVVKLFGWRVQECLRQCQEQIEESLLHGLTSSTSSSDHSQQQQQHESSKHRSEATSGAAAAQPSTPTDVKEVLLDGQWDCRCRCALVCWASHSSTYLDHTRARPSSPRCVHIDAVLQFSVCRGRSGLLGWTSYKIKYRIRY